MALLLLYSNWFCERVIPVTEAFVFCAILIARVPQPEPISKIFWSDLILSFFIMWSILFSWAFSKDSFSFLKYAQEYCLFLSKNKSYNFSEIS